MSSASDQKLFYEICSVFNCSFDEFVGEKVVSPSYSSTILAPPLPKEILIELKRKRDGNDIMRNFNIPFSIMDRTSRPKIRNYIKDSNNTVEV